MTHIEDLTRYIANFIDELTHQGIRDVVISPGSRSTPLAMLAVENPSIRDWILVDERSASYFALGLAKESKSPVVLICTSGTAAANYYPAVIEAFHAHIPLIVLTADRPHELRDVGAPQAMNQFNMYGEFVKLFYEMNLPEASKDSLNYVRNRAARAVLTSKSGHPGPVQLNFPIREPLTPNLRLPDLWGHDLNIRQSVPITGKNSLSEYEINKLSELINLKSRVLIVGGPQTDRSFGKLILKFASKLNAPILADPLSQIRSSEKNHVHIIDSYDAILKSTDVRNAMKPDLIIRFGAMPISKSYLFFMKEHSDVEHIVVEAIEAVREPTNQQVTYVISDLKNLINELMMKNIEKSSESWLNTWSMLNDVTIAELKSSTPTELTEGEAMQILLDKIPNQSTLLTANSMSVRDLDTFYHASTKELYVHGNRGVSGIDGVVSTALGIAAACDGKMTLVIGDLSFYHDINGLLVAKQYDLDITILLINNDGGGIFSFLPQAKEGAHFEKLFGTPLGIDFKHAVALYAGEYTLVDSSKDLEKSLEASYLQTGLNVIEVQTNRSANAEWHKGLWSNIELKTNQVLVRNVE